MTLLPGENEVEVRATPKDSLCPTLHAATTVIYEPIVVCTAPIESLTIDQPVGGITTNNPQMVVQGTVDPIAHVAAVGVSVNGAGPTLATINGNIYSTIVTLTP